MDQRSHQATLLSVILLAGFWVGSANSEAPVFPDRVVAMNGICSGLIPTVVRGPDTDIFLRDVPESDNAFEYRAAELRRVLDKHHVNAGLYMSVWAWEANRWRTAVAFSDRWHNSGDHRMELLRIAYALNLGATERRKVGLGNPDGLLRGLAGRLANGVDTESRMSPGEWRWLGDLQMANSQRSAARIAYQHAKDAVGVHPDAGKILCTGVPFSPAQARLHARGRDLVWLDLQLDINSAGMVVGEHVERHNANDKIVVPALELIRSYRFRPNLVDGNLASPEQQAVRAVVHGSCRDYAESEIGRENPGRLACQRYLPIEKAFIPFVYGGSHFQMRDVFESARSGHATHVGDDGD